MCSRDTLAASLNGLEIVMSRLETLRKHIAGRVFEIKNLHGIISDGKIAGCRFLVVFPATDDEFYFSTGVIEKDELQTFGDWLVRNF